jgi:YD repeat-containing protein
MKHILLLSVLALILVATACETYTEETEATLLPLNISMTLVQGSQTTKILADFYYVPETNLLDHITWSNHQTHYFEYDAMGRLKVVRKMKVDVRVQEERWFYYENDLVKQVDLVKRNLDYTYLEPVDSIFTGYVEYTYDGENVIEESEYEITEGGYREEYIRKSSYSYDGQGNLIAVNELDPRTGETNQISMSYDQSKHPYFELTYYWEGMSYVNNMLSKTEQESGMDYTYEFLLNDHEYPETVYEKLGSAYTRIISYSYLEE